MDWYTPCILFNKPEAHLSIAEILSNFRILNIIYTQIMGLTTVLDNKFPYYKIVCNFNWTPDTKIHLAW